MAREATRKIGKAYVVSQKPDVCLTPMGCSMVPVPYSIIAIFDTAVDVAPKVRMTGKKAFHMGSHLPTVTGNEAGSGGGVFSGVNVSKCYPIQYSPTVRIQGQWLVRHDDLFEMNCASPGNTTGKAVYEPPAQENSSEGESLKDQYERGEPGVTRLEDEWGTTYKKELPNGDMLDETYFSNGKIRYSRLSGGLTGKNADGILTITISSQDYPSKPIWWPNPPDANPPTGTGSGPGVPGSGGGSQGHSLLEQGWDMIKPNDYHDVVDYISYIPGANIPAGIVNTVGYLIEGQWGSALFSAVDIIPGGKWVKKAGKGIWKGAKWVANSKLGKAIGKKWDEAVGWFKKKFGKDKPNPESAPNPESPPPPRDEKNRITKPPYPPKPKLRQQYEEEVQALSKKREDLLKEGKNPEEVARELHADRRDIGEKYKDLTPEELRQEIYTMNQEKYGDPLGPSIDYLRNVDGKTWGEIAESAANPGGWERLCDFLSSKGIDPHDYFSKF